MYIVSYDLKLDHKLIYPKCRSINGIAQIEIDFAFDAKGLILSTGSLIVGAVITQVLSQNKRYRVEFNGRINDYNVKVVGLLPYDDLPQEIGSQVNAIINRTMYSNMSNFIGADLLPITKRSLMSQAYFFDPKLIRPQMRKEFIQALNNISNYLKNSDNAEKTRHLASISFATIGPDFAKVNDAKLKAIRDESHLNDFTEGRYVIADFQSCNGLDLFVLPTNKPIKKFNTAPAVSTEALIMQYIQFVSSAIQLTVIHSAKPSPSGNAN